MTYKEYREKKQKQFNELPIFYAFSNKQLEEELKKRGYELSDAGRVLYRLKFGGFYLKTDKEKINDYFSVDHYKELHDMMEESHIFALEAFEYEMSNHEYPINWQGDWDVCSCFGNIAYDEEKSGEGYLRDLGYSEGVVGLYSVAARNVRRACAY